MNNMMVPLGLRGTPCISNNNDFKFRMFQNELFVGSSYFNYGNWSCPRSQASLHLSRQPWHRCYYPPDMPTDFAARTGIAVILNIAADIADGARADATLLLRAFANETCNSFALEYSSYFGPHDLDDIVYV